MGRRLENTSEGIRLQVTKKAGSAGKLSCYLYIFGREKRERLVACVLSGNSKQHLGKEYTEQQINEMDCNDVNTLLNRYESVLSA